jgi:hypothetical protein
MKGVTSEIVSAKEIGWVIVGVDVEAKAREVEEEVLAEALAAAMAARRSK